MKTLLTRFATPENRWYALFVIALGLGVVIIDNTVLNVSVPYILRDLHTGFNVIEWSISGYALTIAAVIITAGRLGEMFGYKKMFVIGLIVFVAGSIMASEASSGGALVFGRAAVQAVGAAIVLTSALALLAANFEGRDRAIAFGIWGSVAGAAATIGPLLGGYLTTYFSWRWSLRINVIVGLIALIGTLFIRESKRSGKGRFDWIGTFLSGAGLLSLVFAMIEGQSFGWIEAYKNFPFWPFSISVIPFFLVLSIFLLAAFVQYELRLERRGGNPVLHMDMFRERAFTVGLALLFILTLGMFGVIFVLPIYFENTLGFDAMQTGLALIPMSLSVFLLGTASGFLTSRFSIRNIVISGLFVLLAGMIYLIFAISPNASALTLAPALALFGVGFGLGVSQLNNIIISSVPSRVSGEASAASATMRQVGSAIGIALIGTLLTASLATSLPRRIEADPNISPSEKPSILADLKSMNLESGSVRVGTENPSTAAAVKQDINASLASSARIAFSASFIFILLAFFLSLLLPKSAADKPAETETSEY